MARIRVMQLVMGLAIGEQSGGAEQIGILLTRYLDQAAFESALFAVRGYGSPSEQRWLMRLSQDGTPVYGLAPGGNPSLSDLLHALRELWRSVSAFRPHIITSHSERADLLNALVCKLHPLHPRTVRVMHTDQQWQTRPHIGALLLQGVFPLVFDAEIAVSDAVRTVLEQRPLARLRGRKSALCYEGIDGSRLEVLPVASSPPPGLPAGRPLVGIVGRLAEQKGHIHLLQALALIPQSQPVHLAVIGAGPLEEELRNEAAHLGIADVTHFLGSRSDVLSLLPHLDVLVSASLWEGLPAAILEAMALGVPVVATNVSGSREVVLPDQTGIRVPAADPAALAEGIQRMLADPARAQRMAANARQMAARFTVQNAIPCYEAVYRQVLSRAR